jgi:DNA-directed RNA polymerase specialized sigma24 family protein
VTVGPSEAFTLFFKNNSDPVFRTLLAGTLNRAAAEDATAEAFARAFAHWDTVAVQREVLVLVALGELTPTQAARVVGKPAGTVRRLLFQARVALHQALDEATAPEEEDD